MTTSFADLLIAGILLALVQFVAALPWVWAIDPRGFRRWTKDPAIYGYAAGVVGGLGLLIAWFMSSYRIPFKLHEYGQYYGSILHAQLALDFLILAPQALLFIWPKGGAVALSTFRECWRQPMFWLISSLASLMIVASMVIPYFTFGEDYKMMKQLGFDAIMLAALVFGLLAASISIYEEIEGRTAITVISKPISRRQFLLGKYVGTLLACWAMVLLLGWLLTWALYIKPHFDQLDDVKDSMPIEVVTLLTPQFERVIPTAEGSEFAAGAAFWFGETLAHHVGLLLTFGQVMVLLAICTALATRLPFVINLIVCMVIFVIGRLAPVLVLVTNEMAQESAAMKLVSFIAQLLNALFPALEYFDIGPAIIRSSVVPMWDFCIYVGSVFGYAVLYSTIGLLLGLILFEDRDLA